METVLESCSRSVTIGPEMPFVMIGERINPTGRKILRADLLEGNFDTVRADAVAQVEAGAGILDVNAGVPGADEPELLKEAVRVVQEVVDVPLSIDSSVIEALEAALPLYKGKALVNSVTGEEARMERVLPLIKKHGAAVIGLAHDDSGISMDPQQRLAAARRIVERAADHGIPAEDVIIDPLVMTVGAKPEGAVVALETVRLVRQELGNNLTCGASNVSFGLPGRVPLTAVFLTMAMSAGLPSAIMNPLAEEARMAVLAGNLLLAHDTHAAGWIGTHRPRS